MSIGRLIGLIEESGVSVVMEARLGFGKICG